MQTVDRRENLLFSIAMAGKKIQRNAMDGLIYVDGKVVDKSELHEEIREIARVSRIEATEREISSVKREVLFFNRIPVPDEVDIWLMTDERFKEILAKTWVSRRFLKSKKYEETAYGLKHCFASEVQMLSSKDQTYRSYAYFSEEQFESIMRSAGIPGRKKGARTEYKLKSKNLRPKASPFGSRFLGRKSRKDLELKKEMHRIWSEALEKYKN